MVATNKHVFVICFTLTFGEDEHDEPIFDEDIFSDGLVQPPTRENCLSIQQNLPSWRTDGQKSTKKNVYFAQKRRGGSYQTKTILGLIIPLRNPTLATISLVFRPFKYGFVGPLP